MHHLTVLAVADRLESLRYRLSRLDPDVESVELITQELACLSLELYRLALAGGGVATPDAPTGTPLAPSSGAAGRPPHFAEGQA